MDIHAQTEIRTLICKKIRMEHKLMQRVAEVHGRPLDGLAVDFKDKVFRRAPHIWEDWSDVWYGSLNEVLRHRENWHEVLEKIAYEPESFGTLKMTGHFFNRTDKLAREMAREPFAALQAQYVTLGAILFKATDIHVGMAFQKALTTRLLAKLEEATGCEKDSWMRDHMQTKEDEAEAENAKLIY